MTPDELAALAMLADVKKQQELARLHPLLAARQALTEEIAGLRTRLAAPPASPEDPGALLRASEHRAVLDKKLREKLQALSRLEALIAQASPALARATARLDVAEKLETDARKAQKKRAAALQLARNTQLTS